ncbi:MAG: sulfotransferase [Myxococcota bacterium]
MNETNSSPNPPAARSRPAPLPLQFRAINAVGALGRSLGLPLAPLDERSILDAGIRLAGGLDDFGTGPFFEPLKRLVDSLENEARLSFLGRNIARGTMVESVRNRLCLIADRKRYPEIAKVEVVKPLVIVGGPRTGSTILQDLLACDPRSRAPLGWEAKEPSPPPERARFDSDPRIARCEAQFENIDKMVPDFRKMHPLDARNAQECLVLTANSMVSGNYHAQFFVPGYYDYLERGCDWRGVLEFHKEQLQHLQWRAPGSHWVLKTGQHNLALDALLDTYPHAGIIVTHRDPVKIATSFASLSTLLRSMGSDHVDGFAVSADWCPRLAFMFEQAMKVRDSGKYPESRFYDMHFRDLVGNWLGVVERIYDQFGLELRGDAVDAMGRFMEANKPGKHGKHAYTPEQYGIDVPTERERFRRYTDRYGIEAEK